MDRQGAVILFGYVLYEEYDKKTETSKYYVKDFQSKVLVHECKHDGDMPSTIEGLDVIQIDQGYLLGDVLNRLRYSSSPHEIDGVDSFVSDKVNVFVKKEGVFPKLLFSMTTN